MTKKQRILAIDLGGIRPFAVFDGEESAIYHDLFGLVNHLRNKNIKTIVIGAVGNSGPSMKRTLEKIKQLRETNEFEIIRITERYTSMTCLQCDRCDANLSNSTTFRCECGYSEQRDIVGAKNIYRKYFGQFEPLIEKERADSFPKLEEVSPAIHDHLSIQELFRARQSMESVLMFLNSRLYVDESHPNLEFYGHILLFSKIYYRSIKKAINFRLNHLDKTQMESIVCAQFVEAAKDLLSADQFRDLMDIAEKLPQLRISFPEYIPKQKKR